MPRQSGVRECDSLAGAARRRLLPWGVEAIAAARSKKDAALVKFALLAELKAKLRERIAVSINGGRIKVIKRGPV